MAIEVDLGRSVTRESQRHCPKDRTRLAVVLSDGAEVDACETCRGVWVDYVEEKDILRITPDVFTLDEFGGSGRCTNRLNGGTPCATCHVPSAQS